jgi:hypothetical protein
VRIYSMKLEEIDLIDAESFPRGSHLSGPDLVRPAFVAMISVSG